MNKWELFNRLLTAIPDYEFHCTTDLDFLTLLPFSNDRVVIPFINNTVGNAYKYNGFYRLQIKRFLPFTN